ncbi:hypothetical protein DFQ30_005567 [Apophysomyces sp. BC1015]|nr:hypothetical protein DFQ30_005567 [Apophysomyces sp. BC1015]
MRTSGVNAEKALDVIKSKRAFVAPNSGFLDQLELYDVLKYDVDPSRPEYRRFLVVAMAEQQQANGYIDNLTLAPDPEQQTTSVKVTTKPFKSLRCKKCRRILVEAENVIDHTPGPGQQAFAYTKRNTDLHVTEHATNMPSEALPRATVNQALNPLLASLAARNTHCSSYFVEPMEWITALHDGQLQGRIECPKCMSKLGSYSWSGEQCSCGRWITPAFMLHRKQVDEVKNVLKRQ